MTKLLFRLINILFLTLLTQVGGVAWIIATLFRRWLLAFALVYTVLSLSMIWIAPTFGRVQLSCGSGSELVVRSYLFCALNRNYVVPEMRDVLVDLSQDVNSAFPGTKTVVLDANFPLIDGFPLLPHLSHSDGRKADIAFYYQQ